MNKNLDVLIIYERKQRELENSVLLQIELEKRGFSCEIVQFYEAVKFDLFNIRPPKIIVVPHLYNGKSLYRTLARFGHASHVVNMQYEQVLSKKWEELGAHTPKGEAQNGIHICWGNNVAARLEEAGVPSNHLKVVAPLHLDLLRRPYLEKDVKQRLSKSFNLSSLKRWVLFISSFTYADIDPYRLKMNENSAGVSLSDFPIIHTQSRNEILAWLESALTKDAESLLIYRPHPDELSLDSVYKLSEKYKNFHVVRDGPVKDWINASDVLYTWYSTSVVEAHFMEKPYSILRPFVLPDYFDSVLLKHGKFIESKDQFLMSYLSKDVNSGRAIDDCYMNLYYNVDSDRLSKDILGSYFEYLLSKTSTVLKLKINGLYIRAKLTSFMLIALYISNKVRRFFGLPIGSLGLVSQIFSEIDSQIASDAEKRQIKAHLLSIVGEQDAQVKA